MFRFVCTFADEEGGEIYIKWLNSYPSKVKSLTNVSWLEGLHICEGVTREKKERKCNFTFFKHSKWGVSVKFSSCGLCNMCLVKHHLGGYSVKCSPKDQALSRLCFQTGFGERSQVKNWPCGSDHWSISPHVLPHDDSRRCCLLGEHVSLAIACDLSTCLPLVCVALGFRMLEELSLPVPFSSCQCTAVFH